ncbi:cytoplasmic protein [Bacillus sp. FJAT-18019]|nr:cytoplasmic protein [Bacillus sp. FJAT-18019]
MKINDGVFGELDYDYIWSKNTSINYFGVETTISLMVKGDEEGIFDKEQYFAYQMLMENWEQMQISLLQSILNYYQQKRHELGYDITFDANYPFIDTTEQLMQMITLDGIVVPYGDINEERDIGILFNCTWDLENGLGLRLLDEKVVDVGYQDVAI